MRQTPISQVAQSWNPALFKVWGAAMGAEQAAKGSNVMLGPAVALTRVPYRLRYTGDIMRLFRVYHLSPSPCSGRNFEYYSEDPRLNAALAGPMVQGIQSNGISACVKHWIFNSQVGVGTPLNCVADTHAAPNGSLA